MSIEKVAFGRFWNDDVSRYIVKNHGGIVMCILDYGAIIQSLAVPGRDGVADILLGFETLQGYLQGHPFFGAIAGRVANRIPGGTFSIDGTHYRLGVNAPFGNHLHGGFRGFDKYVWKSEAYCEGDCQFVRLERLSPDGEEGYPGNLDVTITYGLDEENVLSFEVAARTDKATIVNIVQHSYFNLAGHDCGDIRNHELQIEADSITVTDENLVPTGEIKSVAGTPFDFREPVLLDAAMKKTGDVFDINYVLKSTAEDMAPCAILRHPQSGRCMRIATNQPGLQFYNGHKIYDQNVTGKDGQRYPACAGLCLETQAFPNAVNIPEFPSMVVRPEEKYHNRTTFSFSVE